MYINTTGLILRETKYKDSSKILTVLTESEGKLTVSARGALRKDSKLMAATQPLAYSEMTLSSSRDRWTMTEARPVELFSGLSGEVTALALGSYFAELIEAVSDEDMPNPELLSLALNALYVLSESLKDEKLVKPAFEMRLMCLGGFAPRLERCNACGKERPEEPVLDVAGGVVLCGKSCGRGAGQAVKLCDGSLGAMRHIVTAEAKKIYSFKVPPDALGRLARAAEGYTLAQLDRRFGTLDFYKSLR